MKLTGQQVGQIQEALINAYTSRDALRMMVRIELGEILEAIAGGDNQRVVAFNLVSWAEQTGRIDELIQGAYRYNKGNEELQKLVQDTQAWHTATPSPKPVQTRPLAVPTPPAEPASIDVFLSYSRKDVGAMRRVQDSLREAGLSVWTDEGLEPGTQSWQNAISEAAHQAQAMVVLLSPNANASSWVKKEISFAQIHGKRVFSILISGDETTAVPISLIDAQWVDGRENLRQAVTQTLLPALRRQISPPEPPTSGSSPTAYGGSAMLDERELATAVKRLQEVQVRMEAGEFDVRLGPLLSSKAEVLARFQPIFAPEHLPSLTEAEFRSFLLFKNNHHWGSLQRQGPRMCADMDTLRSSLAVLLDESRPIEERYDYTIRHVSGMGCAVATAILLVMYPEKYGVWNSTSEGGLKAVDLWPSFDRGAGEGSRYVKLNAIFNRLCRQLTVDLWKLDALWYCVRADGGVV